MAIEKVQSPNINFFITKVTKRKRDDDDDEVTILPDKRNQIEIPEHMLEEILLNLPGKSLMRFKCVSKEWKSLISSHRFNRGHLHRNVNKYSFIIQMCFFRSMEVYNMRKYRSEAPKIPRLVLVDCDSLQKHQQQDQNKMQQLSSQELSFSNFLTSCWDPVRVTCCCDGILCIALGNSLFLWNPYTNDHKRLPLPDPDPSIYPLHAVEAFGIGYDSSIDDYKLVRVPSYGYYAFKNSIAYVMTLKLNLWRKIDMDFPYVVNQYVQPISADGHLYWRAASQASNKIVLLGFDLAKETFSEVPMPPNADKVEELGVLGGFLSLAIPNKCNHCFDIWIMKGRTWIKLLTFPLSSYKGPGSIVTLRPLFFNQDGALVMYAILPVFDGDMGLVYDSKAGTCKLFKVGGIWKQAFVYTQSLVSLSD